MGDTVHRWENTYLLRCLGLLLLLFLVSGNLFAQARDYENDSPKNPPKNISKKGFDPDKLIIGGNLGAQFGNITLVEISPQIGYLVKPNILMGIGGRYLYYEDRTFIQTYRTNIYGGSIFSQYYFLENFIAHAEYELLNLDDFRQQEKRVNIQSIFLGGGYRSMIGGRSFVSILLLYNLNETYNSPYTNPILRIGVGIGL